MGCQRFRMSIAQAPGKAFPSPEISIGVPSGVLPKSIGTCAPQGPYRSGCSSQKVFGRQTVLVNYEL